jgi:hypothetical protein
MYLEAKPVERKKQMVCHCQQTKNITIQRNLTACGYMLYTPKKSFSIFPSQPGRHIKLFHPREIAK